MLNLSKYGQNGILGWTIFEKWVNIKMFSWMDFPPKNWEFPRVLFESVEYSLPCSCLYFSQSKDPFFVNFKFVGMLDWIQVDCFCKQLFGWIWLINPYVDMLFLGQHHIPSLVGNNWCQQFQTRKNWEKFILKWKKFFYLM